MALKTQRLYYVARNNTAGLSDVRATIYRNVSGGGMTPVATNLPLAEVDPTNATGVYALIIPNTDIVTYGGAGDYVVKINSVSKPALAITKFTAVVNDADDLDFHLTVIESKVDTVITNQATMANELTSIKNTVQSSNNILTDVDYGNANLKALLESAINSIQTIQNTTRFMATMPSRLIIPSDVGTTEEYELDIRLFDNEGNHEDPDNDQIYLSISNNSGIDRSSYIVGFTAGPVLATKVSQGIYKIRVAIPDTAGVEQLKFNYTYTENAVAFSIPRTTETVVEESASGLALQSTLLDVLADTSDIQPRLVTLQNYITNPAYSLETLKALGDIINGLVQDTNTEVNDAVYGLANIYQVLTTKASQVTVDNIVNSITDFKGATFDSATDSLEAISERVYTGGNAI